jgi:hypothetical protein
MVIMCQICLKRVHLKIHICHIMDFIMFEIKYLKTKVSENNTFWCAFHYFSCELCFIFLLWLVHIVSWAVGVCMTAVINRAPNNFMLSCRVRWLSTFTFFLIQYVLFLVAFFYINIARQVNFVHTFFTHNNEQNYEIVQPYICLH